MEKTVFDNFDKATLISFIQQEGYFLRYKKKDLLRRLGYLEWEIKTKAVQKAMDAAIAAMDKIDTSTIEGKLKWFQAQEDFNKAMKMGERADKKHERYAASG